MPHYFHDLLNPLQRNATNRLECRATTNLRRLRLSASFAGQFYGLREHSGIVRERIRKTNAVAVDPPRMIRPDLSDHG
jgi:hypothetical protein